MEEMKMVLNGEDLKFNQVVCAPVQGAPSRDVPGEYQVRFPGETTLGHYACLYT